MHRRAFIARLVTVAAAATVVTHAPVLAQTKRQPVEQPKGLAAVKVDTGPIAARGLPGYARRVAAVGTPAAQEALAPIITGGRGAPTLVLSLSLVQLTSDPAGSRDRFFGRDNPLDWIEGDAILLDARGREMARKHIMTTNQANTIERISTPYGEDLRIARIVEIFARWAKSELSL